MDRPTLLPVGEADPSCPPSAARLIQGRIAGSRLAVLPATSNISVLEHPALVNAHLASFLAQVDADRSPSTEV